MPCHSVRPVPASPETCPDRCAHLARCRWSRRNTGTTSCVPIAARKIASIQVRRNTRYRDRSAAALQRGGRCSSIPRGWPMIAPARDVHSERVMFAQPIAALRAAGSIRGARLSPAVRTGGRGAIIESRQGMVFGRRGSGWVAARRAAAAAVSRVGAGGSAVEERDGAGGLRESRSRGAREDGGGRTSGCPGGSRAAGGPGGGPAGSGVGRGRRWRDAGGGAGTGGRA